MFDSAFANLATAFSNMAGGPFIEAVATWPGAPTYDSGGSITAAGEAVSYACRAQFDAPTQAMRAAEGFLQTDMRVLVLAKSIAVPLDTGAQIVVADGPNAGTWALLTCQRDPVAIGYECAGRRISTIPSAILPGDFSPFESSDGLGSEGGRLRVDIDELPEG